LPTEAACRLLDGKDDLSETTTMWKTALVGATALVIAGSAFVYAQQRPGMPGFGQGGFGGWRPNAEDMSAFADARIAALRAGLRLNPDQEKHWPAFEQALRDAAKMRMDRLAARRDQQPPADPVERLQRRADALSTRGAALKRLADAATPLYQSLDEGQKQRFAMLSRFARPGGHPGMWRGDMERRGDFRDGRGFGDRDFRGPGRFRGEDGPRFRDDGRGPRGEDDYSGRL